MFRNVIARVLAAVAVVFVLLMWWEYRGYLPKPAPSKMSPTEERQLLDDTNFELIVWAAADDMHDPDDMLMAAITIENAALDKAAVITRVENGQQISERVINVLSVVGDYETLQAPSQCIRSKRTMATMGVFVNRTSVALVSTLFREYRKNPSAIKAKWPWIEKSRRYLRTRNFNPLPPYQFQKRMRDEMEQLYVSPGKAEYFAFKPGVPQKCD